jgi:hypothetical protein
MQLRSPARLLALATVTIGVGSALVIGAPAAMAAHESANHLSYAPVAGSASPGAGGRGIINYVKGTSGAEPNTQWTSSFRFSGLAANMSYTVTVKGRSSAICSFTTTRSGNGGCATAFTGLEKLGVSQLVTASGAPVLQATRQVVAEGPGSITSSGGCREPAQGGSTCAAPGRS